MRLTINLIILFLTCRVTQACPTENYVVHESRSQSLSYRNGRVQRRSRARGDGIIPVRIGLTQSNLDIGYQRLMEVSHPSSLNYGKHLSHEEVVGLFAPGEEAVSSVKTWLVASGIRTERITHYENKGWLSINMRISEAENLFRTQYHEIDRQGEVRLGCDQYSVPKHLRQHIDYITPGVKPSGPMRKRSVSRALRRGINTNFALIEANEEVSSLSLSQSAASDLPPELQKCTSAFTPACFRALYGVPANNTALPGNSVGLFELFDTYAQEDLDAFWAKFAPEVPKGTAPLPAFINGATAPVPLNSTFNLGESPIDMTLIQSLVYPQTITLYQNEDRPSSIKVVQGQFPGFLNTFLDALDGSYCNSTDFGITGDSPGIDAVYPNADPGGFKGPKMCGAYKPAKVISFSYSTGEANLPANYVRRQCNEFMKLGLQGTTFIFSSGDFGVASTPGDISPSGCTSGSGQNGTIFTPQMPMGCPFVTIAGATQIQENGTIKDPETAMQGIPGKPLFTSGGGFSNFHAQPDYQKAAVENFFAAHDPGHPSYVANADATNVGVGGGLFNRAGRAYPDVAAVGKQYQTFIKGAQASTAGTSVSAPFWAALVTLVNQERQAVGKGPVGFINPVLYAHPEVFNDIVNGSNPNCGSSGFSAVPGWDPVTGLGTPKYPELLRLFLSLP
ncbi:protease S8 tripeptidyl peptidase I [Apiospora sp. TS-2023a]